MQCSHEKLILIIFHVHTQVLSNHIVILATKIANNLICKRYECSGDDTSLKIVINVYRELL